MIGGGPTFKGEDGSQFSVCVSYTGSFEVFTTISKLLEQVESSKMSKVVLEFREGFSTRILHYNRRTPPYLSAPL